MGKYANLEKDVFSIFATNSWKSHNIKTFPANYLTAGDEYIRVNILPNGAGINRVSVSGILLIDIFVPKGQGPNKVSLIADKLDEYLVGKSPKTELNATTQLFNSSLATLGIDPDNPTLYRAQYSIQFSYFGIL
jgi:hypothetical protein